MEERPAICTITFAILLGCVDISGQTGEPSHPPLATSIPSSSLSPSAHGVSNKSHELKRLHESALAAFKVKDYDLASKLCKEILKLDPRNVVAAKLQLKIVLAKNPEPTASPPSNEEVLSLVPVSNRPGYYIYPGESNEFGGSPSITDCRPFAPGTIVQSPMTHKHYRVPWNHVQVSKP